MVVIKVSVIHCIARNFHVVQIFTFSIGMLVNVKKMQKFEQVKFELEPGPLSSFQDWNNLKWMHIFC